MHDMVEAATAGDRNQAESLDAKLEALHTDLFIESNPIPVKWAVHDMDLMPVGIRLPLTKLNPDFEQTVRAAMQSADVN
jgi:4-hydroxy-tetrahydrodipicolinate synthase